MKEISIITKIKETSVYMRLSRGRKKNEADFIRAVTGGQINEKKNNI